MLYYGTFTFISGEADADITNITKQFKLCPVASSRLTCGYTSSAGYRQASSKCSGIGYCTFSGFLNVLNKCFVTQGVEEVLALIRGEGTAYRFIKMSLLYF